MVLLTAAQIATALEGGTYSEVLNAFNPYVVEDVTRREYPSIDVENITGQEKLKNVPTTNDKQIYLVHLYYRITGFGDADEPNVKLLEDEIFDVIDALQDTSTKITITESWEREHQIFPTPHIHSTLRVTTDEISSTKSGGITGDDITITFPSPLDTLEVIDLITDGLTNEKDLDITIDKENIFTQKYVTGQLDVKVVLTAAQESQLVTMITAGNDISITLTKSGSDFVKTVNLTTYVNSAPRDQAQSTTISMSVK